MSDTVVQTALRSAGPPGQPDIAYTPDLEKYLERSKKRLATEDLSRSLPEGFPAQLDSDLVWEGTNVADVYDWNHVLSDHDIAEVDTALRHFQSLEKPLGEVSQATFPLPRLHPRLRDISREVHNGHGFAVLRGLPVERYSRPELIAIYTGISAHIAPVRGRQDSQFEGHPADVVLAHIKDLSATIDAASIGAPAYTTEKQVFHTDVGDVVALFALQEAAEGGQSYLSSSWRVYNELAATRPDLVRTLAEPWAADEFGKNNKSYSLRPLLHHQTATGSDPERVIVQYARRTYTGYWGLPRSADIPPITEAQAEALDALHFTAEKFAVALDFHQGDIQYINNLSIFHARGSFKDSTEKHRHLVRLWLRDPELAWKTPVALQERWDRVYKDVRPENEVFPLEPTIRSASRGK